MTFFKPGAGRKAFLITGEAFPPTGANINAALPFYARQITDGDLIQSHDEGASAPVIPAEGPDGHSPLPPSENLKSRVGASAPAIPAKGPDGQSPLPPSADEKSQTTGKPGKSKSKPKG